MKMGIDVLPIEFIGKGEVRGFRFHQVQRGVKACIYEVTSSVENHFEVFMIKVYKVPKSNTLYETYPKSNAFGIWAWSFRKYDLAVEKFKLIEADEKECRKNHD